MNKEEKFVIKTLKDSQNTYIENTKVKKVELSTDEAKVVLNLIEKQQKEIEELKQNKYNYEDWVMRTRISKDKIREKLKEYDGLKIIDKSAYEEQVKPLKELLGGIK